MKTFSFLYIFPILIGFLAVAPPAHSGTILIPGAPGGAFSMNVKSLKEARFGSTMKQQYDFSCGSAALATLLSYHYEDHVGEQEVFNAMFESGNKEKIRAQGFSLLDMKRYLEANGYKAAGYETSIDTLLKAGVPAIVLLTISGYKHFVVVKGVSEKEVLVGDPATGVRRIPRSEFAKMWNGLLFLIRNKADIAKHHFNSEDEWRVKTKAPLETSVRNNAFTDITLFLR